MMSPHNLGLSVAAFSRECVVAFDHEGQIQYWNAAAEACFGWPSISVLGKRLDSLSIDPVEEARRLAILQQEGRWHGSVQRRALDGRAILVSARRHLVPPSQSNQEFFIELSQPSDPGAAQPERAAWRDINDRMAACWRVLVTQALPLVRRIESSAPRPESQSAAAFESVVDQTQILEVNERTARLVGGNRGCALLVGQRVSTFWPKDSRRVLGQLLVEVLADPVGSPPRHAQMETDGILRNPVVTVWRSVPENPDEVHIAVQGAADDDRSYLFLRASEERYRKLIHFMPVALWQVDASHMGKIYADLRESGIEDFEQYLQDHPELVHLAAATVPVTDVNRSAIELFGGHDAQDLIRPVGYLFRECPASLRRVMIGRFSGRRNYSEFMKIRTLDDRVLDVRFSVTYPEPMKELDTTIFSLEDVTDRLRMEAQLRQMQADYSHAARVAMMGQLTSSIAHEVNQPLAAIRTNADTSLRWLQREEPDLEKVRLLVARISDSASRADEIVRGIRAMIGNRQTSRCPMNLNQSLQECLLLIRHEIESRDIVVTTSYSSVVTEVIGDQVQIQQVMVNLLLNAIQAIDGGEIKQGQIVISTGRSDNGSAYFVVEDNGPGIKPDDMGRIFDGFFTTKDEGMGIGLAICQSIIHAHSGTISADRSKLGGAAFSVTFPTGDSSASAVGQWVEHDAGISNPIVDPSPSLE